jgi:hypothetical protein
MKRAIWLEWAYYVESCNWASADALEAHRNRFAGIAAVFLRLIPVPPCLEDKGWDADFVDDWATSLPAASAEEEAVLALFLEEDGEEEDEDEGEEEVRGSRNADDPLVIGDDSSSE